MPAIYQADTWCNSCADAIRSDLRESAGALGFSFNPGDERTYDSDEYPKYMPDDEESDCPQHCGAGPDCLEAETLPDGTKIGALLSTNLTSDGIDCVRAAIAEGGTVAAFWADQFTDSL